MHTSGKLTDGDKGSGIDPATFLRLRMHGVWEGGGLGGGGGTWPKMGIGCTGINCIPNVQSNRQASFFTFG